MRPRRRGTVGLSHRRNGRGHGWRRGAGGRDTARAQGGHVSDPGKIVAEIEGYQHVINGARLGPRRCRVVVDAGNGMGGHTVPAVLGTAAGDVIFSANFVVQSETGQVAGIPPILIDVTTPQISALGEGTITLTTQPPAGGTATLSTASTSVYVSTSDSIR